MIDKPAPPARKATGRTQEERSAASRAKLIESAIQLMRDRGLAATNMNEIARSASLTRGAIQHHFNNRSELILAVIEELDERIGRGLASISIPEEVSGLERLSLLLDHVIAATSSGDNIAVFDIWSASRSDPDLRDGTLDLHRQLTDSFRQLWRRNLLGHLDEALIELSFDVALTMSRGAAMGGLLHDRPEEIDRSLVEAKVMLMEFLKLRM